MPHLRRAGTVFLRAWAAAAWLLGAAPSAQAEPPAQGLIVRLKNATPHDELGDPAVQRRHLSRWHGVLRAAALSGTSGRREPALRAVGRDQQLLDFGRGLSAGDAERIMRRLRRDPAVEWVTPNAREHRLQAASDPLSAQQWWLRPAGGTNGNALADRLRGVPGFLTAWQSGLPGARGSAAAIVAVLDTGITEHPDLAGRVLPGHDFVSDSLYANDGDGRDGDPGDPGDGVTTADLAVGGYAGCTLERSSWHGTVIAGIIAAVADNGIGVAGINPLGRVLPVRVAGKCGATVADIVDGMRWAAGLPVAGAPINPNPARIVNISFGGSAPCGNDYLLALAELHAQGVVVVAAAGNEHGAPTRPASCPGVVGVVALNRDGFKSHYSNFGGALSASGVATVGGDDASGGAWATLVADSGLYTVANTGIQAPERPDYAAAFGTSFAAPLVAGTMSLMLSVNPVLTADQLMAGVRLTARPHPISPWIGACSDRNPGRCLCSTATCGAGILDAHQALLYAARPGSYVPPRWAVEVLDNPELVQTAALGPDRGPDPAESAQAPASGGGALGGAWVAALALAAALLYAVKPRRARRPAPLNGARRA